MGEEKKYKINMEKTKNEKNTITVEYGDKKSYIHSKYDPEREATKIIESYSEKINSKSIVIFFGLGLGFHIKEFLKVYPNTKYYIYEPIEEIINIVSNKRELERLSTSCFKGISVGKDFDFLRHYITNENLVIITLPSYEKVFEREYNEFSDNIRKKIKDIKTSIGTNLRYQNRWIVNAMKNLKYVLNTPNILDKAYTDDFKDKPVIIVSAGPSLNEDIEHIRYIKDNKLAYIFSVGSAINTLIENYIEPDATFTYDPNEINREVFKKYINSDKKDIPVVFGSTVGYETLEDLDKKGGICLHFLTNQDSVSDYYLKSKGDKNLYITDAPSIAVLTLNICQKLGFNQIIFAGQNLAFKDGKRHSSGIDYSKDIIEENKENFIEVKNVYGENIFTDDGYKRMKEAIEIYISMGKNIQYINTTKGGAHIEGAEFMPIEDLIGEDLRNSVLEEGVFFGMDTNKYDADYIKKRKNRMNRKHRDIEKLITEYNKALEKIGSRIRTKDFNNIYALYIKLDRVLKKIEKNDYFKIFVLPTMRVQYKLLVDSIDNMNDIKDSSLQAKEIFKSFKNFIDTMKVNIIDLDIVFEEMLKDIEIYLDSLDQEI